MTVSELAMNWITNDRTGDYCHRKITLDEATWIIEHMDPDTIEDIEGDLTPEAFVETWNDIIEEETKTKTINYLGRDIELTSVFYNYRDDAQLREGVFVHDSTDEFRDGDSIFGNGWKLEYINDAADLDSLFGDPSEGTNYFHRNFDGTYTIDA